MEQTPRQLLWRKTLLVLQVSRVSYLPRSFPLRFLCLSTLNIPELACSSGLFSFCPFNRRFTAAGKRCLFTNRKKACLIAFQYASHKTTGSGQ